MAVPNRLFRFLTRSIRGRLLLLVGAVLLPAAFLASWLIFQTYQNERRAIERQLSETARAMSALVESKLREREALLRALAASRNLKEGDLVAFRQQAEALMPGAGEWLVLSDATGQQLLNTSQLEGAVLPADGPSPEVWEALRSGRAFISNLRVGPASGRHVVYVVVGVPSPEGPRQALALVLTPEVLNRAWFNQQAAEGWLFALIDRDGVVTARSRDQQRWVGTAGTPDMVAAVRQRPAGLLESVTLDGVRSLTAFYRVPGSGWTVIIAAPKETLLAKAHQMLWVALAVSLLSGLAASIIAARVGRAVVVSVQTLVASTRALARGEVQEARNTGIDETDIVARALAEASQELAARGTELARARDEALAASRAKDDFLAALSHELRTPLNPALLLASDAARDPAHTPAARHTFSVIAKNVSLEARLIDDLLDLTRIARGKLRLDLGPVDVNAVLRDAIATVQAELSEKHLTLHLALAEETAPVVGDATRLQQVFWNVLCNAIKFTPADGSIRIKSQRGNSRVRVEITDTGMGLTAGELQRIFAAFSQGDHAAGGSHRFGGLGLGLSISRQLVELHAGTITAESKGSGRGATFVVELPLSPTVVPPAIEPIVAGAAVRPAMSAGAGRRILLVEDHSSTRIALVGLLNRRGFEVVPAETFAEAVRQAAAQRFDLVISDIGLPDGDGHQLMKLLRERHELTGIALTGYGSDDDVERSRQAGFVAHLTKPVTVRALESALALLDEFVAART
jgi:signal transduction histidine kinase/ActR/RegA family two-component response regulator